MLVLVDGVSQFADLKQQVKSRDADAFDAAIGSLLTQGLIYEVMLVAKGQLPDVVESELLDRFLREDIHDSQKPVKTTNFQIPSAIISDSHEGVGVSIDTRKQTNLPLDSGDAELDLYLPLGDGQDAIPPQTLVLKAARKKIKVVQVFPEPEPRKRKRRKKRPVETGLDRRSLFYSALLLVALVIIGASIYIRAK
ncbi:MAG: hypothetical protein K2X63_02060 [Burkholderiaceae bacterium]|nr:hypothetical protein [Burkholderiaceae bacterium]